MISSCGEACGPSEDVVLFWFCIGFAGVRREERIGGGYAFQRGSSQSAQRVSSDLDRQTRDDAQVGGGNEVDQSADNEHSHDDPEDVDPHSTEDDDYPRGCGDCCGGEG